MTSRAEQKQRTRAHLLEVAARVCTEQGILATSTARIAREAGVSHGTIFVHFPTRDDLVAAVIQQRVERFAGRIHALTQEGAGLRAVLEAHLDGLAEDEALYARLVTEGPVLPDFARTTLLGLQSAISHHLTQAAQQEGQALRPVPMHLLFNTWIGLVHHYVAHRDLFSPGQRVLVTHRDELIDHFLGLLAP